MRFTFPVIPVGSAPDCSSCRVLKTDPLSVCPSGFSVGNGSQTAICRTCGQTTLFDFAPEFSTPGVEYKTPTVNEVHVIAFADGTFLGRRWVRTTLGDAVLYSRADALEKAENLRVGTFSIIPLSKFDLDSLRDEAALAAEAGR
ncbi:MAG: hypothetical protein ABL984_00390 [Pyrinomonadaceae bacterium]